MPSFQDISLIGMKPSALDLTRDGEANKTPMVRLYQFGPGTLALQLRSLGATNTRRGGVEKHIVSDVHLDWQQARRLAGLLAKWADQQKAGGR